MKVVSLISLFSSPYKLINRSMSAQHGPPLNGPSIHFFLGCSATSHNSAVFVFLLCPFIFLASGFLPAYKAPTLSCLVPSSMCVKEQSKWVPSTDDEGHLQRSPSSAVAFSVLLPLPFCTQSPHFNATDTSHSKKKKRNLINMADPLELWIWNGWWLQKKPCPFSLSHTVISHLKSIFTLETWGLAFW